MECLYSWGRFLHEEKLPPLVHAALAHSQFETIHPFVDGNGRVGRLLITLELVARDVTPSPLLYLSAYFEATRNEYYDRLLAVTQHGEWEEWLIYFLHGIHTQSEDVVERIERIDDLVSGWRDQLAGIRSAVPSRALDLFVENPFWDVSGLADRLDVTFTTANRAVARLESAGILTPLGSARRNRLYYARELLEILD